MSKRFGDLIANYWWAIILAWVFGVAFVWAVTPEWDSVTHDGDIAYLPSDLDSVAGTRLLEQAFPTGRSKSEMVVGKACSNSLVPATLSKSLGK